MNRYFKSTPGAILGIICFSAVYYWLTKWVFLVACSLTVTLLFFGIDLGRRYLERIPKYIYYHLFPRKLSTREKNIIAQHFSFYRRLTPYFQNSFDHLVASFLKKYPTVGRQSFYVGEEQKIMIAASYTQLSFGMNACFVDSFRTVLVYPDYYVSSITGNQHFGEFNPGLKVVVLSWKNFLEGIRFDTSNYNLGIHEFTHAILSASRRKRDASKTVAEEDFSKGFFQIKDIISDEELCGKIVNSSYFRNYAFTNVDEFTSVILEHFFETPDQLRIAFPELYDIVKKMINYRQDWFQS